MPHNDYFMTDMWWNEYVSDYMQEYEGATEEEAEEAAYFARREHQELAGYDSYE